MDDKVNLAETFASFDGSYTPKIIGDLNDYKLQVVKARGDFVWHKHDETDELFLVVDGQLTIQLRDRDIELGPVISTSCAVASSIVPGPPLKPASSSSSPAARPTPAMPEGG